MKNGTMMKEMDYVLMGQVYYLIRLECWWVNKARVDFNLENFCTVVIISDIRCIILPNLRCGWHSLAVALPHKHGERWQTAPPRHSPPRGGALMWYAEQSFSLSVSWKMLGVFKPPKYTDWSMLVCPAVSPVAKSPHSDCSFRAVRELFTVAGTGMIGLPAVVSALLFPWLWSEL